MVIYNLITPRNHICKITGKILSQESELELIAVEDIEFPQSESPALCADHFLPRCHTGDAELISAVRGVANVAALGSPTAKLGERLLASRSEELPQAQLPWRR